MLHAWLCLHFLSFPISAQLVNDLKLDGHSAIAEQLKRWKNRTFSFRPVRSIRNRFSQCATMDA